MSKWKLTKKKLPAMTLKGTRHQSDLMVTLTPGFLPQLARCVQNTDGSITWEVMVTSSLLTSQLDVVAWTPVPPIPVKVKNAWTGE